MPQSGSWSAAKAQTLSRALGLVCAVCLGWSGGGGTENDAVFIFRQLEHFLPNILAFVRAAGELAVEVRVGVLLVFVPVGLGVELVGVRARHGLGEDLVVVVVGGAGGRLRVPPPAILSACRHAADDQPARARRGCSRGPGVVLHGVVRALVGREHEAPAQRGLATQEFALVERHLVLLV